MTERNSATVVTRASPPPRLRVGLPAPGRARLVARRVSEGTWAPWLAVGRAVAVVSRNCARLFSADGSGNSRRASPAPVGVPRLRETHRGRGPPAVTDRAG